MNEKPVYLLAGGRGFDYSPVYKTVLKEISGTNPIIAYVGVANNDDERFYKYVGDKIAESGTCILKHAKLASTEAEINKAKEIINQADAIFMSGGDVEFGIQILESLKLKPVFRELYRQGKVFFGISAGSIMLAREWVRWKDPNDDTTAEIFPCMNIAPVLIDTHAEEDDWIELKTALKLEKHDTIGYGIPSGACLKVCSDGRFEAIGGQIVRLVNRGNRTIKLDNIQ
jgi:cyanophycinase-like exopeptidase